MKVAVGISLCIITFCLGMYTIWEPDNKIDSGKYIISVYDYNYQYDKKGNPDNKPVKLYMVEGKLKISSLNDSFVKIEINDIILLVERNLIEIERVKGE